MKLSLSAVLLPCALSLFAFGCAAGNDEAVAAGESNLDTSGCSGIRSEQTQGAVSASVTQPPTASCWNVDDAGVVVKYHWLQSNQSEPNKNVSFYVALNGGDDFQKADSASCEPNYSMFLGHDTSGVTTYDCYATKNFNFRSFPELKAAAYDASGRRTTWNVQVAVAFEDGRWDSLDGANYRFSF